MRSLRVISLTVALCVGLTASVLAQLPEDDEMAIPASGTETQGSPPEELDSPDEQAIDVVVPPVDPTSTPTPGPTLVLTPQRTPTPNPESLSGATSGSLTGNPAGSFAYANFYYPGDGTITRITATYSPNDVNANRGFGVDLYQRSQKVAGVRGSATLTRGITTVEYASSSYAGPIAVQIGNYNPGLTITYSLSIANRKDCSKVPDGFFDMTGYDGARANCLRYGT